METDVLKQYRSVNVLRIVQIHCVSFYFILLIPPLQPDCLVQSPQIPPPAPLEIPPQLFEIFI